MSMRRNSRKSASNCRTRSKDDPMKIRYAVFLAALTALPCAAISQQPSDQPIAQASPSPGPSSGPASPGPSLDAPAADAPPRPLTPAPIESQQLTQLDAWSVGALSQASGALP